MATFCRNCLLMRSLFLSFLMQSILSKLNIIGEMVDYPFGIFLFLCVCSVCSMLCCFFFRYRNQKGAHRLDWQKWKRCSINFDILSTNDCDSDTNQVGFFCSHPYWSHLVILLKSHTHTQTHFYLLLNSTGHKKHIFSFSTLQHITSMELTRFRVNLLNCKIQEFIDLKAKNNSTGKWISWSTREKMQLKPSHFLV